MVVVVDEVEVVVVVVEVEPPPKTISKSVKKWGSAGRYPVLEPLCPSLLAWMKIRSPPSQSSWKSIP